jgi:glycosyltransferase involved in cell wall biosynthesis
VRIAFVYDVVYPFVPGGVQRRIHALASRLATRHEVTFYGFGSWDASGEGCLPGCRYVSVGKPVPLHDARGRRRLGEAIVFALRLARTLPGGNEEVLDIANFPYFSIPVAWLIARWKRRALVVTWHEYWGAYWDERLGRLGGLGRLLERACLALSPTIVAVSEYTRRRIVASGVDPDRVRVVPNGIDFHGIEEARPAAERSDLIWVGRLIPHKNAELALRAFALLARERPELRLLVVGDGPERGRLEGLAASLGIAGAVRFAGFVKRSSDVYGLMKSSRVLLAPHRKEGFGITVVEGWGCGIPAVVCREPQSALPDLVDEPVKGRVAEPSPEAVGAACRELLDGAAAAGREVLAERAAAYDWERIAGRLEAVYRESLDRSRGQTVRKTPLT